MVWGVRCQNQPSPAVTSDSKCSRKIDIFGSSEQYGHPNWPEEWGISQDIVNIIDRYSHHR